ncbi:vanadium-dependent haloperoxidase [Nakamurella endophytica]|uniref:PAP2 superfamily protein n=1 Tax=Nakamurella endophytica TaxID=1748367 RepID=A0A917SSD3_9ACTN|nr:vanadium-dependent haloperoxidase [Nakamurella endophytica]GGL93284.1 hypothetical protein GCM10011594_11400 [Nakamurella endophytica]
MILLSRRFLAAAVVATACLAVQVAGSPPAAAHPAPHPPGVSVITSWNAIALRTVYAENATPIPSSSLYLAFVSTAVYDAVVTVEGRYQPFTYRAPQARAASSEVAAATAAFTVLRHYFPASTMALEADYAAFVAGRPAGHATDAGMRVGRAAAEATIASREGDGRNAERVLTVTPGPGVWRPTPPALAPMLVPWLGFVRPLVLRSPTQIRLPGPDRLTSRAYARDFAEVKAYGARQGSLRSAEQTETALFWNANSVAQYRTALAGAITRRGMDIVQGARAMALLSTSTADSVIACWRAKYDFHYWRPVTAIALAATDGNPATVADPSWQPLVDTPPYPDYLSGHACITGAATNTFSYLFGRHSIDVDIASSVTGTTRHFDSARALDRETIDARIWLGLHFRRAMTDGNRLGHQASAWTIRHAFRADCR